MLGAPRLLILGVLELPRMNWDLLKPEEEFSVTSLAAEIFIFFVELPMTRTEGERC